MRIHSIEAIAVDVPLNTNFGGSTYDVLKRSTIVTRLKTEGGLISEVYNGDNREHGGEILRIIHEQIAPLVKGMSIDATDAIFEKMFTLAIPAGNRKVVMEAIACVDTAVWDVLGKASNRSVRSMLGGYRSEAPLITIGGYYVEGKTLADIGLEMESYRVAGMAGCKFKVGGLSPQADAERVAVARKAAGDDFILAVDANRGWNTHDAITFARLIEAHNIRWFEEPCHWYDDAQMMARVRQATSIPITAGQSEISAHGVRRLVDAKSVDVINFDASEGGGISEWRRAASVCALNGIQMAHHEEAQIAQHLITAVPHGTYIECFVHPDRDPVWQTMWANRPPVRNGIVEATSGAGFGLQLDNDFIEKYRVR